MTPPDDTPDYPVRAAGAGRDIARTLDPDYEAILAAVTETARGRWFLDEYARRNRTADTRALLKAMHRIEKAIPRAAAAPLSDDILGRLNGLVELIGRARVEIAAVPRYDADGPARRSAEEIDFLTESETGKAAILRAHESAERIQEIVWNLRERQVSTELCDMVDRYAGDIQAACRSGTATLKGMNAMGRALRHLETKAADLAQAASARSAPPDDDGPDIFGGDLAVKRFLEEIDIIDVVDIDWHAEDVGDTEDERARRARAEAMPQPPAEVDFDEESDDAIADTGATRDEDPAGNVGQERGDPQSLAEDAERSLSDGGEPQAATPSMPPEKAPPEKTIPQSAAIMGAPSEKAPAALALDSAAGTAVVTTMPDQQAAKPRERGEKPADLTGLTFDQKMILFS